MCPFLTHHSFIVVFRHFLILLLVTDAWDNPNIESKSFMVCLVLVCEQWQCCNVKCIEEWKWWLKKMIFTSLYIFWQINQFRFILRYPQAICWHFIENTFFFINCKENVISSILIFFMKCYFVSVRFSYIFRNPLNIFIPALYVQNRTGFCIHFLYTWRASPILECYKMTFVVY